MMSIDKILSSLQYHIVTFENFNSVIGRLLRRMQTVFSLLGTKSLFV